MNRSAYKLFERLTLTYLELIRNPNAVITFATYGEPIPELKRAIEKLQKDFPGMTVEWHDCTKPVEQPKPYFLVIDDPMPAETAQ